MLANFAVNNFGDLADIDDDGELEVVPGSLRQAINLANANLESDTIIFEDFLFDSGGTATINLSADEDLGGPLLLTAIEGIEIIGPGPGLLTITAGGNNRIFLVDDGDENVSSRVTISGMRLTGGNPIADDEEGRGGAILNRENLTLTEVHIGGPGAAENFAPGGGGAVFNETGRVRLERSLIQNNTSGQGGGGIQNGILDETENLPTTTIINSTITGNTAIGIPADDTPTGYGGGVLNLAGTVNIEQSTIYGNSASVDGGGVASQGFDPMLDDMGMPTVYMGNATTNFRSSIIVGNTVPGTPMPIPNDVGSVGMTEGDDMTPPMPFDPQMHSNGFNLFGILTFPMMTSAMGVVLPPGGPGDVAGVNPTTVFIDDPNQLPTQVAWLNDFGGVLPVFMPDINKVGGQMTIDHGDPSILPGFDNDQRGFQFVRIFDGFGAGTGMPIMDIGAAEAQVGNFMVDTLVDDFDGRFANVPVKEGTFPNNTINFTVDFSLREALDNAQKNQQTGLAGTETVTFSTDLTDPNQNPDPTLGTAAPTILLTLGELPVNFPVNIQGPGFDLEVDATGNDPSPGVNNGDGSRVFNVSSTVAISNLILRGGDEQEFGGAILVPASGNLTLTNSTILDNTTTGRGGAINVQGGTLLVDSSTLHANTSAGSGGGINVASGTVTVNNSTISGNTGGLHGGGIANANGTLLIGYSTITLNTAGSTLGSGVASFRDQTATTTIRSSIISGNTFNDVQHVLPGTNNIVSQGYNLVGDGNAVLTGVFSAFFGDQTFTDPMLDPLARLGGPTPVHRLQTGSTAIDMGDPNNAGLGNVPMFDQRGFPFDRIEPVKDAMGNPIPGSGRIDIGAFETQDDVLLVGNVPFDPSAAFATFAAALAESNATPENEQIVFLPSFIGLLSGSFNVTDSVAILGLSGLTFSSSGFSIDDGSNATLLDVSFDTFRFDANSRLQSKENLTLSNMDFVNNASSNDGGALSQQFGTLTINNTTFIGNSVSGVGSSGGAIHALDTDVVINNSFLSGNTANNTSGNGGAIYHRNGSFTANYLYITGNTAAGAAGKGGGMYARDSNLTLTFSVVGSNSTTGSNSAGGGLSTKDSDVTLIDSFVTFNTNVGSQSGGAGIAVEGGSLDLQNGIITNNKTYGHTSSGGGISSVDADVTISGTTISNNEVSGNASHGGGVYATGGNLTVRDAAVINNHASASDAQGGGIFSITSLPGPPKASIINSTVSGNSAGHAGGGIFNGGGLTEILHSTITENEVPAYGFGGGVGSYGDSSTTRTEVGNSIIAGNTLEQFLAADFNNDQQVNGLDFLVWQFGFGTVPATKADGDANGDLMVNGLDLAIWEATVGSGVQLLPIDVDRVGGSFDETFMSLGYNVIGGGLSAVAFTATGDQVGVTDPGLGPLTPVLRADTSLTHVHPLLAGSPAIDMGDPGFDPNDFTPPLDTDQRGIGFQRVDDAIGIIDVGAFEVQRLIVTTTVDEDDGTADPNVGAGTSLREAINANNLAPGLIDIFFDSSLDGGTILIDQSTLGALPRITNDTVIDASSLTGGLTIDAGDGADNTPGTADGIRVFDIDDFSLTRLSVTLRGLTLTGGDITGAGGAISSFENLTVENTTIMGNATTGIGGGIHSDAGNLTVTGSTISGNSASSGGGIFSNTNLVDETATIRNSTISGNSATVRGGGIYNYDGLMILEHSTVTGNTAPVGEGSGVASYGDNYTRTRVGHSIIAGNNVGVGEDIAVVLGPGTINSFVSLGYNLIGTGNDFDGGLQNAIDPFVADGTSQTGIADPMLGPLAANGGPTATHALLAGSPAIDMGDPGFDPNDFTPPLDTDQRGIGFPRVENARIDIGAFELTAAAPIIAASADFDQNGEVSGMDFLAWQVGLGTANAALADGDSDNDADVDGADLGNWSAKYGTATTVTATAASSSGTTSGTAALAATSKPSPVVNTSSGVTPSAAVAPASANAQPEGAVLVTGLNRLALEGSISAVADREALTAIDQSLAQFVPEFRVPVPLENRPVDVDLSDPRPTSEQSEEEHSAEDSVFEMLGEQVV